MLIFTYSMIFAITIVSALIVIVSRNTFYSAISLIVTMIAIAGNFLMMRAELIALVQLLVYAGAIMVLFLFVIMLLNLREEEETPRSLMPRKIAGLLLAMIFIVQAAYITLSIFNIDSVRDPIVLTEEFNASQEKRAEETGVNAFAETLFTKYMIPFELTSVLLLAAIVGAVAVGLKEDKRQAAPDAPQANLQ
ncbi:NADH-quinone oxidoreductase subunit J [Candidatus Sumerlaeota bacterium]|nr:NADH-quinone oxidoreductase subunit J [Candidatus Sumerlaeota bacterium]